MIWQVCLKYYWKVWSVARGYGFKYLIWVWQLEACPTIITELLECPGIDSQWSKRNHFTRIKKLIICTSTCIWKPGSYFNHNLQCNYWRTLYHWTIKIAFDNTDLIPVSVLFRGEPKSQYHLFSKISTTHYRLEFRYESINSRGVAYREAYNFIELHNDQLVSCKSLGKRGVEWRRQKGGAMRKGVLNGGCLGGVVLGRGCRKGDRPALDPGLVEQREISGAGF